MYAIPLIARLPFFYGWVVLACVCCAGVARQGPAVGTLSIFVEPMTADFGWSRTALSGAVSLGGVMAAVLSPLIGPMLDRRGARAMLCSAVLVTGACNLLLSLTQSLAAFYLFFCIARMSFAGPFDTGIYRALNSWFIARRPLANAIVNVAQMAGLAAMPLIAIGPRPGRSPDRRDARPESSRARVPMWERRQKPMPMMTGAMIALWPVTTSCLRRAPEPRTAC
jgi:MFS transporter, OFA family, oxalate/formate antiporter